MKHIVLMPNTDKDGDYAVTLRAAEVLYRSGAVLYIEESHATLAGRFGIRPYEKKHFPKEAEGMIVFGGDGSILDAADIALRHNIPLLGVNMGRLGYLAELEVTDVDRLSLLLADTYAVRHLQVFSVLVGEKKVRSRYAVNEVTVSRGNLPHIADMRLHAGGGSLVYRADGLIIATPTGSTAYSLSAGGPVIDASLGLIAVTPICPHSFFARSVVFSSDTAVSVENMNTRGDTLSVSIDGREERVLRAGEKLTVKKAAKQLHVISLNKRPFLDVLKEKMCL